MPSASKMGNMIRILGMPDVNLATGGGSAQLDAEITARQNADYTLQLNLNSEITSRSEGDQGLTTDIGNEVTARKAADTTLQNAINSEATARQNADSTITSNLNSEITARQNSDSTITSNLNLEITARQNSDSTITSNLNLEVTARQNSDSTITSNLNLEISARLDADSTLQSNINAIFQGDKSFRLKSIVGTTLTIEAGFMLTASGTEFRLASDLAYPLASYSVDGDYYVCLDLLSFDSSTPTNVNGRIVYDVTAANILLLSIPVNYSRYAPLGTVERVAGTWVNQQTIAKFRHEDVVLGADASLEYSMPFTAISSVGSAGQIKAGHILTTLSFPSTLSATQYSYYNLTSINDGTSNARNLTNNGTILFNGIDILGNTSGCASLNGSSQWFSTTSSFFNPGNNDFTCGGWFKPTTYTSGLQTLFGQWSAIGNLSFMVRLTAAGMLEVYASSDGTTTAFATLNPLVTSGWMHVVMRYSTGLSTLEIFVNSTSIGSLSTSLFSASSPDFAIGRGASNNYFSGLVDEFFFATPLLTDNGIAKLYAYKLTHNRLLSPESQRWYFWGTSAGQTRQIDNPVIDIDPNEVWWDLSAESASVAAKLHNVSSLGSSKPAKSKTLELTASEFDSLLPITHNLGVVPEMSFKVKNIGNDYEYEMALPFVATTTQIKFSGTPGSSLTSLYGASTICILNYSTTALSIYIPSMIWNTYTTSSIVAAVSDQDQVFWDTTSASCTAILPAAPTIGTTVRLIDFKGTWGTNQLVVVRSGNKIQGLTEDLYLNIPWDSCTLVFDGVDNWHLIYN